MLTIVGESLTKLFNRSLAAGVYPSILNRRFLVLIDKKGPSIDFENYIPIVILPVIAKVIEKVVAGLVTLSVSRYITPNQDGFISGCSPVTNLLIFQSEIFDAFSTRNR